MIYILGKSQYYENNELEDIVIEASTKIDDILNGLLNVKIDYLSDYSIFVTPENSRLYETIYPRECAYETFVNYTPTMFTMKEYKDEYEHVKNQLFIWCNTIKEKKKKLKEEAEQKERERKEKRNVNCMKN